MRKLLHIAVLLSGVALILSGCGGDGQPVAKAPPSPAISAAIKAKARLAAHGYTVSRIDARGKWFEAGLLVHTVDWASLHTFDVYIFMFDSPKKARTNGHRFSNVGRFPSSNKTKRVGANLYVASVEPNTQTCTVVNGVPKCPPLPHVPATDFGKVVTTAEGT